MRDILYYVRYEDDRAVVSRAPPYIIRYAALYAYYCAAILARIYRSLIENDTFHPPTKRCRRDKTETSRTLRAYTGVLYVYYLDIREMCVS